MICQTANINCFDLQNQLEPNPVFSTTKNSGFCFDMMQYRYSILSLCYFMYAVVLATKVSSLKSISAMFHCITGGSGHAFHPNLLTGTF